MSNRHADLIGGVNTFVTDQKKLEGGGECRLSVISFDTVIEEDLWDIDIQFAPEFNTAQHFIPRGGTALYDAVGHGIDKLGKDLAALPEEERPEEVIVLIYTDGEENSSRLVTSSRLKEKIEHQQNTYKWKFIFMGANQDAILTAREIGISADSSITFNHTSAGNLAVYSGASILASGYRINHTGCFTREARLAALSDD